MQTVNTSRTSPHSFTTRLCNLWWTEALPEATHEPRCPNLDLEAYSLTKSFLRCQMHSKLCRTHPRCPEMTRNSLQGGCQAGRGHLLGNLLATAALGVYSLCPPDATGSKALLTPLVCPCSTSCCCLPALALHQCMQALCNSLPVGVTQVTVIDMRSQAQDLCRLQL